MKAAVVQSFEYAPALIDFPTPEAEPHEVLIRVEAAALSQLARSQASGRHYSTGPLPFVPGTDGVGRLDTGERVYFAFPRTPYGAMAEVTVVDRRNVVPISDELDDVTLAAIANPAMSSWSALHHRAGFSAGESVLINGANGVAGRLAIRISRLLGAKRIVVTARENESRVELEALGAHAFVSLNQEPEGIVADVERELAAGVDVVLDYLWGPPAECVLNAVMKNAKASTPRRLRFVNIGSLAGTSMTMAAAALRSSKVEITGSGLGSVSDELLVRSAADAVAALKGEHLNIGLIGVPIEALAEHWNSDSGSRIVFTF